MQEHESYLVYGKFNAESKYVIKSTNKVIRIGERAAFDFISPDFLYIQRTSHSILRLQVEFSMIPLLICLVFHDFHSITELTLTPSHIQSHYGHRGHPSRESSFVLERLFTLLFVIKIQI